MAKKMPDSDCPMPNEPTQSPEVLNVIEATMEAFFSAVTENGLSANDAMTTGAFIAAAIGDGIFDAAMPEHKQASEHARELYAATFVSLVESHLGNMMDLTFDEEGDEEEDYYPGGMAIFDGLNTQH